MQKVWIGLSLCELTLYKKFTCVLSVQLRLLPLPSRPKVWRAVMSSSGDRQIATPWPLLSPRQPHTGSADRTGCMLLPHGSWVLTQPRASCLSAWLTDCGVWGSPAVVESSSSGELEAAGCCCAVGALFGLSGCGGFCLWPGFCGLGEDLLERLLAPRKLTAFIPGMIEFPSVSHVLF